jgi:hypothetical protein
MQVELEFSDQHVDLPVTDVFLYGEIVFVLSGERLIGDGYYLDFLTSKSWAQA